MKWPTVGSTTFLLVLGLVTGNQADTLLCSFSDPIGDQYGTIADLTNLTLTFDNATGDYEIVLTSDVASPFEGDFRINVLLFNPDTGTYEQDPSYFVDNLRDYSGVVPTQTMTLIGANPRLLAWEIGHRVAADVGAFGPPNGISAFHSGILRLPSEPAGPFDFLPYTALGVIVPEPSAPVLLSMGAIIITVVWWRRRRKP